MSQYPSYQPCRTPWINQVPSHWTQCSLKHVIDDFVAGGTPSTSESSFWADGNTGTPWVAIGDMSNRDIVSGTAKSLTAEGLTDKRLSPLPAGSVLYSMYASVGFAAILNMPAVTNQAILGLVHNEEVDPRYLRAFLNAARLHVLREASSNTQDNLNAEKVKNLPFVLPPRDEQLAIAAYLDAETARIDGLIEEKQRLASMLAELRGGVIRERTSGADLKTGHFATGDKFMPQLPLGWSLAGLGRYSRITNGSTPLKDNPTYWQGGHYPWLNSSVVNHDEVTEGSELVTTEALRQCHLPIVPPGSVLVALTGQGKTRGQATVLRIEATINQHLAAIVCDEDHLDGEFVFWALTGQYAALRMVSDGQGGTKGALTCDELGRFRIPKPPIDVQRSIAKALYEETRRIDELRNHVETEIALLQELRSATITDAVLGRIDVRAHMKH